ncbi:MAG: hypothetical protein KDA33_10310, partial [Phycisphaerales bacterium]|nr:hypothetical protein [Phycisphaerales bacterium]
MASRVAWRPGTKILATAIVLLAGVLAACFPPAERNENFRLRKMLKAGWRIARGEDVSRVLTQKYAGYDVGTPLFLAVTMKLTQSADELAEGPPTQAPPIYHWAHRAGFIVAITALFAALWRLTTPFVAAGVATLLIASPNWRFIAWSDDVYVFPLYAFTATCVAIAVINQRSRIAWPALIVSALAIGAACTFRNVSLLCVGPLLLLVVKPTILQTTASPRSTRIRAAATFLIATLCAVLPGKLVGSPGHVFWHPMHCGLAEFGGHEDAQARLYPWFFNESELPDDAVPVQDWTDERSYRRARALIPNVVVCSPEYDAIMRDDYLALWKAYPVAMLQT